MPTPQDVLDYWLDELPSKAWYVADPDVDKEIHKRFFTTWENLTKGSYSLWLTYPSGFLAYIIVADQFSRNMFRDVSTAFLTDKIALAAAKTAISKGWDLKIDPPARQFFYLPLMHSENLSDQDRCIRLFLKRMPDGGGDNLVHARAHREVIRKFGRFPYRNGALSRKDTDQEREYLALGGYLHTLQEVQAGNGA